MRILIAVLLVLLVTSCGAGCGPAGGRGGSVHPAKVLGHAKTKLEKKTTHQLEVIVNRGSTRETVLIEVKGSEWRELKVDDKVVVRLVKKERKWIYELAGRFEKEKKKEN